MRAVLDTNVLVSALLTRSGPPARVVRSWIAGQFELIVSPLLLNELKRVLAYRKLQSRVHADEAEQYLAWLARSATVVADPAEPSTVHARDPDDDYLLALASSRQAILVSGDAHLLELAASDRPIHTPTSFLTLLD